MLQVSAPSPLEVKGCYERIELPRALAEAAGNSLTGECTLEERTKANGVEPRARGFAYDWRKEHQTIFDHILKEHVCANSGMSTCTADFQRGRN
ncbi:hypothetical protein LY76DRAFT_28859 [Colletotrichum caudatum]|nr:hypothetical protein LY76DRAFT_28859 [Colletotrichum caudatum]